MLSDKKVEETDNLWKIACETLLFPRLFMIAIPFFIFTSLFFIPIDYGGITKFSKTMHGSYQNKWLFDLIFFFQYFLLSIPTYLILRPKIKMSLDKFPPYSFSRKMSKI